MWRKRGSASVICRRIAEQSRPPSNISTRRWRAGPISCLETRRSFLALVAASAKGRLLEQAGRLAEAEASYAVAVAAGAKNDVRRRYARLLRARGALDEACVHFDRAVPWDGRAHPFPRLPRLLDDIVRAFHEHADSDDDHRADARPR